MKNEDLKKIVTEYCAMNGEDNLIDPVEFENYFTRAVYRDHNNLEDVLMLYLDKLPVAEISVIQYKRNIQYFFDYLQEEGITEPKVEDIVNFENVMRDNNYKDTTIRSVMGQIRHFFLWTEKSKIYPNIAKLNRFKKGKRGVKEKEAQY